MTHWGYEGPQAPEHWGSLDPGFTVCSNGREQSPIDLTGAERAALSEIVFDKRQGKVYTCGNASGRIGISVLHKN